MADRTQGEKERKSVAVELSDEELGDVQGGLLAHELTHLKGKRVGSAEDATGPVANSKGTSGA